jgi:hypothetical protein
MSDTQEASISCQSFFEIKWPKNKPGASLRFHFRYGASLRFPLNGALPKTHNVYLDTNIMCILYTKCEQNTQIR